MFVCVYAVHDTKFKLSIQHWPSTINSEVEGGVPLKAKWDIKSCAWCEYVIPACSHSHSIAVPCRENAAVYSSEYFWGETISKRSVQFGVEHFWLRTVLTSAPAVINKTMLLICTVSQRHLHKNCFGRMPQWFAHHLNSVTCIITTEFCVFRTMYSIS